MSFFFFFKQETAYEMRISDWSSDVCSSDLRPFIIAMDGQPVEPHEPPNGRVLLGPAMRLDLMLDMVGDPGGRYAIRDSFYATNAYTLSEIVYVDAPPLRRDADKTPPVRFAPNTMPEPSLDRAERHEVAFQGGRVGMLGGGVLSGQRSDTDDK